MIETIQFLIGEDLQGVPLRWWQVVIRGVVVYVVGVLIVRLGKSRLLSRASAFDVVVVFMLGSILSRAILGIVTLENAAASTVTLVALHWIFSRLAVDYHWLGNLIKGDCYVLIKDGKINWENMRRGHLSERDLYEQLRLRANVNDPSEVEIAYKERSGDMGVVLKPKQPRILDIAVADGVQTVRLRWESDGDE